MGALLRTGGLVAVSVILFKVLNRAAGRLKPSSPKTSPETTKPYPHVRDAGPDEQEGIAQADWDLVDEQSDESFPASDPPANYRGVRATP